MSTTKKSTPGRRRLFEEGDLVRISTPKGEEPRKATIAQYDTVTRKILVKYSGEKQVDTTWLSVKQAERIDKKGKVITKQTPSRTQSRSNSRGRSSSPQKKQTKSVSTRTRSKSRERIVNAEFSATDTDAAEPAKLAAKPKSPTKKRKTISTPKRVARSTAPLKDAEFSADDEPQNLTEAAEKNSTETTTAEDKNPLKFIMNSACCLTKQAYSLVFFYTHWVLQTMHLTFVLFLKNVPMLLTFCASLYMFLTIVDKKNIRYQSLWPLKMPAIPANKLAEFKWMNFCSWAWAGWKKNIMACWSVTCYPVVMSAAFHMVTHLKTKCFPSYKIRIRNASVYVNLLKVWLAMSVFSALVLYMDKLSPYFDLFPIANPVTPVIRSYFMLAHSYCYDALCNVFRSTSKFYFYMLVLALFKSYDDFEFDFDLDWKSWFLNSDDSTSLATRFLCQFGSDMFLQTCFFVLAARNPTNIYLWVIFNARFVQNYLQFRSTDQEESSLKRYHAGNVSGFFFYMNQVGKVFAFTNIWRFISKIERVTSCKYSIALFAGLQLASFVLTYLSNKDWPNEKRRGIHAKIRHADRLSDICSLASMTALCEFTFGNVPYVVLGLFVVCQVVDVCMNEEAQREKSKTKWETYYRMVPFKFIPKVY